MSKALLILEKLCYAVVINRQYNNPPSDTAFLDCLAAKRPLPCYLCQLRGKILLNFPSSPLPPGVSPFPAVEPASVTSTGTASSPSRKFKLTRKERAEAEKVLVKFGDSVRSVERNKIINRNRPRPSYLPLPLVSTLLDNVLLINSLSDVEKFAFNWDFYFGHGVELCSTILDIKSTIAAARNAAREKRNAKQREKRKASAKNKATEEEEQCHDDDGEQEDEEEEQEADPAPTVDPQQAPASKRRSTRKRAALDTLTNLPVLKRPKRPRAPQLSVAAASEDYGPRYRTRRR